MKKDTTLEKINRKIDELIIAGKTNTEQFKTLTRLHKAIITNYELRTHTS